MAYVRASEVLHRLSLRNMHRLRGISSASSPAPATGPSSRVPNVLTSLPNEIIERILQFLPLPALSRLMQVDHFAKEFVRASALWMHLFISRWGARSLPDHVKQAMYFVDDEEEEDEEEGDEPCVEGEPSDRSALSSSVSALFCGEEEAEEVAKCDVIRSYDWFEICRRKHYGEQRNNIAAAVLGSFFVSLAHPATHSPNGRDANSTTYSCWFGVTRGFHFRCEAVPLPIMRKSCWNVLQLRHLWTDCLKADYDAVSNLHDARLVTGRYDHLALSIPPGMGKERVALYTKCTFLDSPYEPRFKIETTVRVVSEPVLVVSWARSLARAPPEEDARDYRATDLPKDPSTALVVSVGHEHGYVAVVMRGELVLWQPLHVCGGELTRNAPLVKYAKSMKDIYRSPLDSYRKKNQKKSNADDDDDYETMDDPHSHPCCPGEFDPVVHHKYLSEACAVALNYDDECSARSSTSFLQRRSKLSRYDISTVEAVFQPALINKAELGLVEVCRGVLDGVEQKRVGQPSPDTCDDAAVAAARSGTAMPDVVVLMGGVTEVRGFKARFLQDLQSLLSQPDAAPLCLPPCLHVRYQDRSALAAHLQRRSGELPAVEKDEFVALCERTLEGTSDDEPWAYLRGFRGDTWL
eukprot:TRINITY_DN4416_c0_g2_i1.p1 TRINITY_DN4416_c0_g2~~TRINITY_DN4416_c0_g2_i1.p1  ORF type:complete len:675 (+),score=131.44 TRINITY_DN4416_c0_g2_i1:117-2027(+)